MSSAHRLPPVTPEPSMLSTSAELELDRKVTHHKPDVLGCQHYPRRCKIMAACCNQLFTCRICHDESVTGHTINRHATERVLCMECGTLQAVAEICIKCSVPFARYFCHICKFYDDTEGKEIYHCKECGICRIGSTENTFHCNECGVCMRTELREHRHIEKALHSDCPICSENMFNSRDSIHYLRCGHSIHFKCVELLYRQGGYGCPVCKKSLRDFSAYWRRFDRALSARPMPSIFANAKSLTFCNDCEMKTESPFHYLGAKCQNCGSYNTTVTGRLNFPSQEELIEFDAAERRRLAEDPAAAAAELEAQQNQSLDDAFEWSDDDFDENEEINLDAEWERDEAADSQESEESEEVNANQQQQGDQQPQGPQNE